jgi:hypothetical protein
MDQAPDTILNEADPGDDVQRRFGFQAAKAAMLSLSLLDPDAEVEEVYCEQHEDVLVKKRTSRFVGYQVKSKLDGSGPHKSTDDEIIRSMERFVEHECQFGQHFDKYVIGSNAGFWDEDKTTSSLPYVISAVADAKDGKWPKVADDYLKRVFPEPKKPRKKKKAVAQTDGQPTGDADPQAKFERLHKEWEQNIGHGRSVLRKLGVEKLPDLRDMRAALIEMLPKFEEIGDRLFSEVSTIADGLVAEMLRAARLEVKSPRERYLAVFNDAEAIETSEVIKAKRTTRVRLIEILRASVPVQPTLCTNSPVSVGDLPTGIGVLDLKMDRGGISIQNIDLAKDLKASTEKLLLDWLHQYGRATADARYQHLRTLVRSVSQEAFDQATCDNAPFGLAMLNLVRERLTARYQDEKSSLFGCYYEHLMGMVAILTEDCTLWWTPPFDIPNREEAA